MIIHSAETTLNDINNKHNIQVGIRWSQRRAQHKSQSCLQKAASLQTIRYIHKPSHKLHHSARDIMSIIHSINIVFMFTNMICAMFTKTIIHLYKYTKALVRAEDGMWAYILWCGWYVVENKQCEWEWITWVAILYYFIIIKRRELRISNGWSHWIGLCRCVLERIYYTHIWRGHARECYLWKSLYYRGALFQVFFLIYPNQIVFTESLVMMIVFLCSIS